MFPYLVITDVCADSRLTVLLFCICAVAITQGGAIQLAGPGGEALQGVQALTLPSTATQPGATILQYGAQPGDPGQQLLLTAGQVLVQGKTLQLSSTFLLLFLNSGRKRLNVIFSISAFSACYKNKCVYELCLLTLGSDHGRTLNPHCIVGNLFDLFYYVLKFQTLQELRKKMVKCDVDKLRLKISLIYKDKGSACRLDWLEIQLWMWALNKYP